MDCLIILRLYAFAKSLIKKSPYKAVSLSANQQHADDAMALLDYSNLNAQHQKEDL